MIIPITDKLDILKWADYLRQLRPLSCGDTIEAVIARFLAGHLYGVIAEDEDRQVMGLCIYSAIGETVFVQAVYAPGNTAAFLEEFTDYIKANHKARLMRFASKHPEKLWEQLLDGVRKAWTVYEYDIPQGGKA